MDNKLRKQESLSDKIADVLTPIPSLADPEDDINVESTAKVVDNDFIDEDFTEGDGKLRKHNIDLLEDLDKRYIGKKSTRRDLEDEWSDSNLEEEEKSKFIADEENGEDIDTDVEDEDEQSEEGEEEDEDAEEKGSDEDDNEDGSILGSGDESNFKHINDVNVKSQVNKGVCVRNQLQIWEKLLELRIQMQKTLLAANKMPQKEYFQEIKEKSDAEFTNAVNETKTNVTKALDKLLLLQSVLLKKYPETRKLLKGDKKPKKVEESDEEIPSDTEEEKSDETDEEEEEVSPRKKMKLTDYENEISKRHDLFRDYRNSVIQKWNEKIRVAFAKGNTSSYSILNQIQYILSDRQRLLKRTQLKRSNYEILGSKTNNDQDQNESNENDNQPQVIEEYNVNIFDDDDFYHQLLRELIEFKSSDISDPVQLGRQWIQLQHLRSKMKRKIDTRATKGRKVRYAVHSKLVNFMAPIDEGLMTEEAKNELFNSLFGKNQLVNV